MTQVVFNNFKYQKQYYYWVSVEEMREGELQKVLDELRGKKQPYSMRTFEEFYVISTRKRVEMQHKLLILDKAKSEYTYSEVRDIIKQQLVDIKEKEG